MKKDNKYFLLPLVLSLTYVLLLTAISSKWSWEIYDELSWIDNLEKLKTTWGFIVWDWAGDARFRPLSALPIFFKLNALGESAHLLKFVRILELILVLGVAGYFLRKNLKLSVLATAIGVGFWVKSPPLLEQIHWSTLSELTGVTFLLLGLVFYQKSKVSSYLFFILAAITKEPLAIFLPIPALLGKKYRETFIVGFLAAAYLGLLLLNRKMQGSTATVGYSFFNIAPHEFKFILKGLFLDLMFLIPLLPFFLKLKTKSKAFWQALVFLVFGFGYFVLVLPRTWGYTYTLMPALFCISMAVGLLVHDVIQNKKLPKYVWIYLTLLCFLFPARLCWNWTKVYLKSSTRYELFEAIKESEVKGKIGTNCMIDRRGMGWAIDRRADGPQCPNPDQHSKKDCCRGAKLLAVGKECSYFDQRVEQAKKSGLNVLFSNDRWFLFSCK